MRLRTLRCALRLLCAMLFPLAAACAAPPTSNVISTEADQAAWTANGRVVFGEVVSTGPTRTAVRLFEPAKGMATTAAEVVGEVTFLDADDTDRILLGGIGGAYTILRQDGAVLYQVVNLPDATDGYVALHLSASGTLLALVTLPPVPDLQVHRVDNGATVENFVDFEGTANVREIDWSPDDAFLYYIAGDPTGTDPDQIIRISATDPDARTEIFQDPAIPYLGRIYVSNDGASLLVSGEDDQGATGVWRLSTTGGTPERVAAEGGNRLTVRAASGPSPDGRRFVLFSTTARGTLLTVEPLAPID